MMKKTIALLAVVAMFFALLPSCTVVDVTEIGTLNGESLLLADYENYLRNALYEQYNNLTDEQKALVKSETPDAEGEGVVENFWDLTITEEETGAVITIADKAKADAFDELVKYTIKLQKVEEFGTELSEDDLAEINSNMEYYNQMYMEYYGMSMKEFVELSYGMSYDEYVEIEKEGKKISKMEDEAATDFEADEEDLRNVFNEDYVRVQHILIKAVASEDGTYSDEAMAEAKAKAEDVISALNGGANFESTRAAYTEDVDADGNPNSPEGYTFNKENNSMVAPFSEEASKLEVGAYSSVPVEVTMDQSGSYAGYHIVYRLDLDDAGFEENREALETDAKEAHIENLVEEWIGASAAVKDEARLKKLDMADYYNTQA